MERVSFQITKLHLDPKLVKYVSTGPVSQNLNAMPQIEEKHEECVWLFLGVLWNTNGQVSMGFQGLEQQGPITNGGFEYCYNINIYY